MANLSSVFKNFNKNKHSFEHRCVIFVNIPALGLMLADIKKMPDIFPLFSKCFVRIKKLEDLVHGAKLRINPENFILTFPVDQHTNLYEVFKKIAEINLYLVELSFEVSGAIIYDKIYHDDMIIEGPALKNVMSLDKRFREYNTIMISGKDLNIIFGKIGTNEFATNQVEQIRKFISNRDGTYPFFNASNLIDADYDSYRKGPSFEDHMKQARKMLFSKDD